MPPHNSHLGNDFFEIEYIKLFNIFFFNVIVSERDTRSINTMRERDTRFNNTMSERDTQSNNTMTQCGTQSNNTMPERDT